MKLRPFYRRTGLLGFGGALDRFETKTPALARADDSRLSLSMRFWTAEFSAVDFLLRSFESPVAANRKRLHNPFRGEGANLLLKAMTVAHHAGIKIPFGGKRARPKCICAPKEADACANLSAFAAGAEDW